MTNIATEIGDWLKSYDIILARNPQSQGLHNHIHIFQTSECPTSAINLWLFGIVTQMTPIIQIFSLDFNWTDSLKDRFPVGEMTR